jgi:hypothetical protein
MQPHAANTNLPGYDGGFSPSQNDSLVFLVDKDHRQKRRSAFKMGRSVQLHLIGRMKSAWISIQTAPANY